MESRAVDGKVRHLLAKMIFRFQRNTATNRERRDIVVIIRAAS